MEKEIYARETPIFYIFEGENHYLKTKFTLEQAVKAFRTLKNCTYCFDCIDCTDCYLCIDCNGLHDCVNYTENKEEEDRYNEYYRRRKTRQRIYNV